jgi:exopolyphosphatase/guanosine-5'-triphosphate,3'-diphosphate pyrophosphatase
VPLYKNHVWDMAYGSSGTLRSISEAIARNGLGDGTLTLPSLNALRQRLIGFGHVDAIQLAGMKPDRAPVLVGGLAILIAVMQEMDISKMLPIEAGLRLGVMWDMQLRATRHDRREQSVRGFLQRFQVDETRANRTADIASTLYARLKPGNDTYTRPVYWCGLLNEVGMLVSHSGFHQHGA